MTPVLRVGVATADAPVRQRRFAYFARALTRVNTSIPAAAAAASVEKIATENLIGSTIPLR